MKDINVVQGGMIAKDLRVGIVASRFNDFIVDSLVSGAVDALVRHGVRERDITLVRVPGAWEMVKGGLQVNEEPVDALASIVHREQAYHKGQAIISKLKDIILEVVIEFEGEVSNDVSSRSADSDSHRGADQDAGAVFGKAPHRPEKHRACDKRRQANEQRCAGGDLV